MMKKLREENIKCKAIILSAYSEFQYAQKAIELKADSYLLKPIKIPELKSALKQAEREISEDQGTEQIFPWKILCWPVCMVRCARIHN